MGGKKNINIFGSFTEPFNWSTRILAGSVTSLCGKQEMLKHREHLLSGVDRGSGGVHRGGRCRTNCSTVGGAHWVEDLRLDRRRRRSMFPLQSRFSLYCTRHMHHTSQGGHKFGWKHSRTFQGHSSTFSRPISTTFYCDAGILKVIA